MPFPDEPVRSVDQLGQSLKQIREDKGLSQTTLADRTGITQKQISKIETGKTNPSMETIFLILSELEYEIQLGQRSKGRPNAIKETIKMVEEDVDANA